jgi:hypothetical protein
MSIGNIFPNIIKSRIGNISSCLFTTDFNIKLMISGSIISYPFCTYALAYQTKYMDNNKPTLANYMISGAFAVLPSALIGALTPIMFYGSPIWVPLWFIDTKLIKN